MKALAAASAAALAAVTAVTAAAGPSRADRPDPDLAAETRSALWEEVTRPGRGVARMRLEDGLRTLRLRSGDLGAAAALFTEVTAAIPDQADGWGYLAIATERLRRWSVCADAYERAWRLDPAWRPARLLDVRLSTRDPLLRPLPLSIALCRGRAGDLAGAATTLASAIARGEASPELWLRTGEIAMAQGRLDDAIAALERAGGEPGARWLLAVAADRARRDDRAQAAAELAHRDDANGIRAGGSPLPALEAGDPEYLLGFAALYGGRPHHAIAQFRRFLAIAPATSPWRPRAAAHLEALARTTLAPLATIDGGGASALDRAPVLAALARLEPTLTACMARIPTALFELQIVVAPVIELKPMPWPARSPARPARPQRARKPAPTAPDASAYPLLAPLRTDDTVDAVEDARGCLERAAAGLRLPPAGAGAWRVRMPVLAPVARSAPH